MRKMSVLMLLALIPSISFACIGVELEQYQKDGLIKNLDTNLKEVKLNHSGIKSMSVTEVLNKNFNVGSRGNCDYVSATYFRKVSYKGSNFTCSALAATEFELDGEESVTHILSNIKCD